MTDTTKSTGGRPWTLMMTATTPFNEGVASNDNRFMNFRADIETSRGIKNRFVSVFNTQRFPNLIEDVKAALASGAAKLTLRFEYDQGETVKVLGVGYVDFRKKAGETPGSDTPAPAAAALPVEEPVDQATAVEQIPVEEPVADIPVEEPVLDAPVETSVAQADPMKGVVVQMKKKRTVRARKKAA